LNHFSEAEAYFEKGFQVLVESFGETHPAIARLYLEKGKYLHSQEKFSQAYIDFDKAIEIAKRIYNENCPALGPY